tara:strand:- start:567 stop:740 length:174 start_codon:yes stop_codon:yes gene_type:complete
MASTITKFEGWLTADKPITDEQYKEFQEYGKTTMSKREKMIYWQVGEGIELLRLTGK